MKTVIVVVALSQLLAGGAEARGFADRDGRSARDLYMEDFLRTAVVLNVEPVGEGITAPKRLTLRRGDEEHRAIFKDVDIMVRDVVRTNRIETCFRDNYRFEAAAYRLDRMLGIGLVPVTVVREVNGKVGSVQEWIEDVSSLRKVLENPLGADQGNVNLLRRRLTSMYVFDSLIYNIDRNHDNILINPVGDRFFLIDHSRSFRTNRNVNAPAECQSVMPLQREMVDHLNRLDVPCLCDRLGDLLSKAQIKAMVKRRDNLLEVLGEKGYLSAAQALS